MKKKVCAFMLFWLCSTVAQTACTASSINGAQVTSETSVPSLAQSNATAVASSTPSALTQRPALEDCPGERLVFENSAGNRATSGVYVICLKTGLITYAFGKQQYPAYGRSSDMSPDRESIVFVTDETLDKVVSFSLKDHSFNTIVEHTAEQQIEDVRWSPDGNFVGYIAHSVAPIERRKSAHLEFVHVKTHTVSKIEVPLSFKYRLNIVRFRWSANSQKVVFHTLGPIKAGANGIFDMTLDCNNQTYVCIGKDVRSRNNVGVDTSLSYDGSLFVGYMDDDAHTGGYLVITDQSDNTIREIALAELTPPLEDLHRPIFSPDGTQVAFVATEMSATGVIGIYILDLNTMKLRNLTQGFDPGVDFTLIAWR